MSQLTIFDVFDLGCRDCLFWDDACTHIEAYESRCEDKSWFVPKRSGKCPKCGKSMNIRQEEFGPDWATCKCGIHVMYRNVGSRIGCFEAYKKGLMW